MVHKQNLLNGNLTCTVLWVRKQQEEVNKCPPGLQRELRFLAIYAAGRDFFALWSSSLIQLLFTVKKKLLSFHTWLGESELIFMLEFTSCQFLSSEKSYLIRSSVSSVSKCISLVKRNKYKLKKKKKKRLWALGYAGGLYLCLSRNAPSCFMLVNPDRLRPDEPVGLNTDLQRIY